MPETPAPSPAAIARRIMRQTDRAVLSTLQPAEAWPYASLVLTALDVDATPLLLISTLAQHTRNIAAHPRVALLFDGTAGFAQPLEGPRVTVLGRAEPTTLPRHRARYLARHPDAEGYAQFSDFAVYRITVLRAHLVAGFGAIHWIGAADLLSDVTTATALIDAEPAIVAHMNQDHSAALDACARGLLGDDQPGWRMTGIDPEGIDLRRGGVVGRLPFARTVHDPEAARAELMQLAKAGRQAKAPDDAKR